MNVPLTKLFLEHIGPDYDIMFVEPRGVRSNVSVIDNRLAGPNFSHVALRFKRTTLTKIVET
jgi:hypothetical protein